MRQIMRAFVIDMERRNLAPATIQQRRRRVETLAEICDPLDATPEIIQQMLDARNLSPRSRYHWISHLHAFYDFARRNGHTAVDPTLAIQRPRLDRLLPRPIADADLALGLELAGTRMHTWLTLMAYGGLRCAEVAALERSSVLDSMGALRVVGKGRKERVVPMHPLVADALARHGMPRGGLIFRRADGSAWPAAKVSRAVSVYFDEIGVDATAHQLRHWFGTMVQRESGDIRTTQELLGHASPSTTAGYSAFSFEAGRAAVRALPAAPRRAVIHRGAA